MRITLHLCPGSPFLVHLSQVTCPGLSVLGHLSWVTCAVLGHLLWVTLLGHLSWATCPVLGHLSWVKCPGLPVPGRRQKPLGKARMRQEEAVGALRRHGFLAQRNSHRNSW